MATALIASGTTAATSADFTVSGAPVTISISYDPANAVGINQVQTWIDLKNSANQYIPVYTLSGAEKIVQLAADGIYRVRKSDTTLAIGIDRS